jgi:hypothetical protein
MEVGGRWNPVAALAGRKFKIEIDPLDLAGRKFK